ncbi:aminodeoxychorismate synthase component I [Loktanella sp. D2R18]|uniref:aminodeoxychorismate synthase component I n=1 Tax=Rhodobacterales TaxID=204455 RepID=UPI000DEADBEE|nr:MULTISPECIES: aminodeoxychorismate synthase component I [Rhodobacterales]MDO6589347.1 aminodeoxychorismate synthase component I [Yoonia sp. 1_MG-2023]RBW45238.1 aminodeoxychorismate synthase component I [Loktanella sp. D2R18]
MRLQFDHGPDGAGVFDRAIRIITADSIAEVAGALTAVEQALAQGNWVAGYASYELGYALEPRLHDLMPRDRRLPLIRFGVYDAPIAAEIAAGPANIGALDAGWDQDDYQRAFAWVHDFIGAGDIYQANLTFPLHAQVTGNPQAIYEALMRAQAVGYGVLVIQDDLPDLLCRSPELFFTLDGATITTRPMKGTAPRGTTPAQDADARVFLQNDPKNRAENLMIVDLLRNDISRVAQVGSVKVPQLFAIETYETVHQMTSTVTAELRPDVGLGAIFRALYPCGSITGAPKLRAMEIIRDIETAPRDAYCGTIGWAAPDGRAWFNVAIRTLMLENKRATLNVGGGVVWDSTAHSEYEEALWKARYASLPKQS